jgi:hypothetical protein
MATRFGAQPVVDANVLPLEGFEMFFSGKNYY